MDFLLKTLDILENVMLVVSELDPGQSPKISEDLGDLRLMRQQIENACGGDTSETGERQLHKQNVSNNEVAVCDCTEDEQSPIKYICTKCGKEWRP